jgi:hypothetical protein
MHYCNMKKEDIWNLTIPQITYLMINCNEHIEFTVRVSTASFGAFFGGGGDSKSEYKEATLEDIDYLARLL